ncbi:MAG TPA: LLM class F420-dependent oxidoreductase [Acidimicrobiales bacterium]
MATLEGTGIWNAGLRFRDTSESTDAAAELEELGYTSLWIPDYKRGLFAAASRLLGATRNIVVASGVANLWAHTPDEAAGAISELETAHPGRFLFGLGVSHAPSVASLGNDLRYEKPLAKMGGFLDGLDAATPPVRPDQRLLAALGPRMLALAAERSAGAHPYNVTPEHTAIAREALGPGKLLVPEQAVAVTTSPDEARQIGRQFLEHYLALPNYAGNLRRLGFTEDDLAGGGSDRLVDALVAWGDEDAIAARLQAHRDAGADSVCIQVITDTGMVDLPRAEWRTLAPALTAH